MFTSPEEVLAYIAEEEVKFLDVRFTDLPGVQQHFNVPAKSVDADFFVNGQLFDGSSIRGFAGVSDSDMQLIPDVTTGFVDPFRIEKTLAFNFSIINPHTGEPYHRDPRGVAERAEAYLESTGIADTAVFAPEAEFFIFEDVRYESTPRAPSTRSTLTKRLGTPAARKRAATRVTRPLQGWLLPSVANRQAGRSARRHLCRVGQRGSRS